MTTRILALTLVAALTACKKDKKDAAEEPAPAASSGTAPSAAGDGGPSTAGVNPHGGSMGDPHRGAGQPDPHGGMATGGMGGMGGAGGGAAKTLEKGSDGRLVLGPVTLAAPAGWQEQPTKGMRAAQWAIPGKAGEAELVVYYFGAGGAGSAEANLERWYQQFEQPDGKPSAEAAKTEKTTVAGMPVTLVEVGGRYVAAMQPGAAEKHDSPDHMMLAAIAETSGGPYYFKLVGPRATVEAARKDFRTLVTSMKPKS